MKTTKTILFILAVFWVLAAGGGVVSATAGERHAGYYYPEDVTVEYYKSRARTLDGAGRRRRIGFVTALTGEQLSQPYPPNYVLFAKGEKAEKLILVALNDNAFSTLYQARALLALLTARARASQLFREYAVDDVFTFIDLLKLLGFRQLTVSDGVSFAHRYVIE